MSPISLGRDDNDALMCGARGRESGGQRDVRREVARVRVGIEMRGGTRKKSGTYVAGAIDGEARRVGAARERNPAERNQPKKKKDGDEGE